MSKAFQDKLKKSRDAREKLIFGANLDGLLDEQPKDDTHETPATTSVQKESEANISTIERDPYKNLEETNFQDPIPNVEADIAPKGEQHTVMNIPISNYQFQPSSQITPQEQPVFRPKRYKKQTLQDTHVQRSYYIEKEIVEIMEEIVGGDTGGKYRFVNDALKLLIYQEYPEYAHRIKKRE